MLAPLMDGMITRDIKARFTAAEALAFLESFRVNLDPEVLTRRPTEASNTLWNCWDRWAGLPKDFVDQWSADRDPPPTYSFRLLQKICGYDFGWRTVTRLREVARDVGALFRRLQKYSKSALVISRSKSISNLIGKSSGFGTYLDICVMFARLEIPNSTRQPPSETSISKLFQFRSQV